jgi:hypothetical protein
MSETAEQSPLEEIKEVINEVVELLNQPNLPVAVKEDEAEAAEPSAPKE